MSKRQSFTKTDFSEIEVGDQIISGQCRRYEVLAKKPQGPSMDRRKWGRCEMAGLLIRPISSGLERRIFFMGHGGGIVNEDYVEIPGFRHLDQVFLIKKEEALLSATS